MYCPKNTPVASPIMVLMEKITSKRRAKIKEKTIINKNKFSSFSTRMLLFGFFKKSLLYFNLLYLLYTILKKNTSNSIKTIPKVMYA